MAKTYRIGYVEGTFDILHEGHLRIIEVAKQECEELVVGVLSDRLVRSIFDEQSRRHIVNSLKNVDRAIMVRSDDKLKTWEETGFQVVFVGTQEEQVVWNGALVEKDVQVVRVSRADISTAELRDKWKERGEDFGEESIGETLSDKTGIV